MAKRESRSRPPRPTVERVKFDREIHVVKMVDLEPVGWVRDSTEDGIGPILGHRAGKAYGKAIRRECGWQGVTNGFVAIDFAGVEFVGLAAFEKIREGMARLFGDPIISDDDGPRYGFSNMNKAVLEEIGFGRDIGHFWHGKVTRGEYVAGQVIGAPLSHSQKVVINNAALEIGRSSSIEHVAAGFLGRRYSKDLARRALDYLCAHGLLRSAKVGNTRYYDVPWRGTRAPSDTE